jgi:hypothetical protein
MILQKVALRAAMVETADKIRFMSVVVSNGFSALRALLTFARPSRFIHKECKTETII